ncbi:hypothetical protein SBA4_2510030 [Candidatus Sulfopaludibacter sp. SbA4]|nr:hypothetical protein SBA4_2510030 [Candidatus Sulfopaludibacter sp. SbA4]
MPRDAAASDAGCAEGVKYGEYEALIEIETLSILRGDLPRRAMALVLEWAALHRQELRADWEGLVAERLWNRSPH